MTSRRAEFKGAKAGKLLQGSIASAVAVLVFGCASTNDASLPDAGNQESALIGGHWFTAW